ncbi:unnamed protein product [Musa acuminata subsp. burmannicoides]
MVVTEHSLVCCRCEEMREELDVESSSTALCTIHCISFESV